MVINPYIARGVEETTIGTSSGFFSTTLGLNVDHELLRHLLLHADASYSKSDYEGIIREDDYLRFGAGATSLTKKLPERSS